MVKQKLDAYLTPGKHAHLIGIGGVSMRPLGLVLRGMGLVVSGSDMNASVSTAELMDKGISVHIGHSAKNIRGADCIIRTAAVHNDNPEIAAARAQGIPVFERAEAWGLLMRAYKNAICVSGTHGKTTTTAMLTHIFMQAQRDPTVMIGGYLPLLHAGHRVGAGDTIIAESCEYCDSFLNFCPTIAIVNNIEADHLDYFEDLDAVKRSFRKFAGLVPQTGYVIANGDDENTVEALGDLPCTTFGINAKNDVHPENLSADCRSFDIIFMGKNCCHVDMQVYGRHNVLNALAAAAAACVMEIDGAAIAAGLASFTGAGRRMEFKGHFRGADIFDDYAHHPGELHALLNAVKLMGYTRIVLAFQPHTYTRTKALFPDFVQELRRADLAVLAEIYAARERNTVGISSRDLAREVPGSLFFETLPEISAYLRNVLTDGDILLTVGAGDIYEVGEALLN
ncbi:MAG: UDP-N-acetylmuramate--L-alanine ligase [Oscillospiraceae bacterium]|jgi:UDP-N-acetylmuramate--alanine ligase|nr:UDP-N-acetylmuramate--L-alanine ligase [Oscillospiraceae bacterium]